MPMRVAVNVLGSAKEPRMQVHREQILATLLRPGCVEVGLRCSEMTRFTYNAGEMILARRHVEEWVRAAFSKFAFLHCFSFWGSFPSSQG